MDLSQKKVLVIGTGVSGIAAISLLKGKAREVVLYDGKATADRDAILKKMADAGCSDVKLSIAERVDDVDLVVVSPGVPLFSEDVKYYSEKNVEIIGEIELAYRFEKGVVAAITGTNGKTTTTTLVGEIMKAHNPDTFVVGNIGNPYTAEVSKSSENSVTVAEISSFQLETIKTFAPKVSAILNITPDHLDRHGSMDNYVKAKEDIAKYQSGDDVCVINFDDEYLKSFKPNCRVMYFSRKEKVSDGAYLDGDDIMLAVGGKSEKIINVHDMHLIGVHNYENVMAAICMCVSLSVPVETIRKVIMDFKAVEHRIEYVRTLNDVIYYNDSKGTNPDASIKAIEAMVRPTVLIAGGYDKHVPFDTFVDSFKDKVRLLVLIGDTKKQIKDEALKKGFDSIIECDTFEEAVNVCKEKANKGDAVLLSPACASWDMFKGYEQRGKIFKDLVNGFEK